MFQIRSVNKVFAEDKLPVELVKGEGYFYFQYDLPEQNVFETKSVYVASLNQLTKDEWIREGRQFSIETEHNLGIYR